MTATQQKRELAHASRTGDLAAAAALLAANRNLVQAWEPMMDACFEGRHEMVKLLLEWGADPNILSGSNWAHRPLHRVVEHKIATPKQEGHHRTVKILMEHGADPLRRATKPPMTAIALAAMGGDARFLKELTAGQPELDIFDAAAIGDAGRLQHLLRKDSSLASAVDEAGCNALSY
ncbi:MAG: ankyrin repeat domain-containing protein, partial [Bryobacteraceae bacterium]